MGPVYVIVICGEHQSNEKVSVKTTFMTEDTCTAYELSNGITVKASYCVRVK